MEISLAVLAGVGLGWLLCDFLRVKPLTRTLIGMKKLGFQPWAEISNTPKEIYPEVREE